MKVHRIKTIPVKVGNVEIGGENPIRIQSMITADTMDTNACVSETISLINSGCEIVRITAPSIKEAKNLKNIKETITEKGYYVPLVADIHYTPNAAEIAAEIVEKVRINPGNYRDKKLFKTKTYSEEEYNQALKKIEEKFVPLIEKLKQNKAALRIGVNHGSLSDRIMNTYGDTPEGMVMSALEFIEIAEKYNYKDIVISMKASNPRVMVHAYRLLVKKLIERNTTYPTHLGVTEAGDGIPGRVKSAIGIGTLLAEGIGDTIRVSLTEPAENEIPTAKYLAKIFDFLQIKEATEIFNPTTEFSPRKIHQIPNYDFDKNPVVIISKNVNEYKDLVKLGYNFSLTQKQWTKKDDAADFIFSENLPKYDKANDLLKIIIPHELYQEQKNHFPFYENLQTFLQNKKNSLLHFIAVKPGDDIQKIPENSVLIYKITGIQDIYPIREHILTHDFPVILQINIPFARESSLTSEEQIAILYSAALGPFVIDGLINGIWLEHPQFSAEFLRELSFEILQASRMRIVKTEYVSCPSCGRTLFDLTETTARIQAATKHLKGVTIAIMGCIVNGPGEMADADYGYVGAGPDRITLYRGKEVVKRNVKTKDALKELIELIKADGKWVEPEETVKV